MRKIKDSISYTIMPAKMKNRKFDKRKITKKILNTIDSL